MPAPRLPQGLLHQHCEGAAGRVWHCKHQSRLSLHTRVGSCPLHEGVLSMMVQSCCPLPRAWSGSTRRASRSWTQPRTWPWRSQARWRPPQSCAACRRACAAMQCTRCGAWGGPRLGISFTVSAAVSWQLERACVACGAPLRQSHELPCSPEDCGGRHLLLLTPYLASLCRRSAKKGSWQICSSARSWTRRRPRCAAKWPSRTWPSSAQRPRAGG